MRKLTLEEWLAEGEKRFGNDIKNWKFVCPACRRVNIASEFLEYTDDINVVYQNCIGRFNGKGISGFSASKKHTKDGCDWAAYGLFGTLDRGLIVINEGKEVQVFDFADNKNIEGE